MFPCVVYIRKDLGNPHSTIKYIRCGIRKHAVLPT